MLNDFPGYLGYGNIIAIHADWPVYPVGIGWEVALESIGCFPFFTEFYENSDIDRCILFDASKHISNKDLKMYIALWHDDLITLFQKGYIEGVTPVTEYQYQQNKFESFQKSLNGNFEFDEDGNIILYRDFKGEQTKFTHKRPIKDDDDDFPQSYRFATIQNFVTITEKGCEKLQEITQNISYNKQLSDLVSPFVELKRYDTAIREASLLIETKLKGLYKNNALFGYKLIDFHINHIIKLNVCNYSAAIKYYKTELRTIFSFVRNDYAHNFKIISLENCKSILFRINALYNEIDEVIDVYFPKTQ